MTAKMKVEEVPVEDLVPYENNPRKNDDAVGRMATAIQEYGFRVPILVRKPLKGAGREIVDGHLRYKAALSLGLERVPTVDVSDLTPRQARALRLMMNKSAEWADWDYERLEDELRALTGEGEDAMEQLAGMTGFSLAELERHVSDSVLVDNPAGEWAGMPGYDHEDKTAFQTVNVHFKDQAARDAFAELVGQTITEHTKFLWYPEPEIETYSDKAYVQSEEQP